ncbi:hypothetical protein, partial [Streptococcus anginosus]|uniref:hypothetical protein n=1 Tax=Streptococcus anginosus TaxID=1328 RepID=UPI001BB25E1D
HQKRKDKICPFSSLAFLQPTTVDKEPNKSTTQRLIVQSTALRWQIELSKQLTPFKLGRATR